MNTLCDGLLLSSSEYSPLLVFLACGYEDEGEWKGCLKGRSQIYNDGMGSGDSIRLHV